MADLQIGLTVEDCEMHCLGEHECCTVQGFLLTTEGLIFKQIVEGKPSPWLIYKKSWGDYKLVGKTQNRPKSSDIEMSFYNDSASENPIVKGEQTRLLWKLPART